METREAITRGSSARSTLILLVVLVLSGCGSGDNKPADAAGEHRADRGVEAAPDGPRDATPADLARHDGDGGPACTAHHDCPQGDYCYRGACVSDPLFKIFHHGKPGCPPGHWCVTPSGARDRCGKDPSFACNDACDCGPAHCCMTIAGVGKRCVRDLEDPWLPAPAGASTIYGARCPADAPTYCCGDASCHAGKAAYGAATGFVCYDRASKTSQAICGGKSCQGTACHCAAGQSCVDTLSAGVPAGKACGQLTGGSCLSNAIAEAVFGWKANEILPCCTANCAVGQRCDRGFRTDGRYAFSRIAAVCGGTCGNQSCDFGETPASCPADCAVTHSGSPVCDAVWTTPSMCGDGVCQSAGVCDVTRVESCATCPEDCGKCAWKIVHGQGGFTARSENMYAIWGAAPDEVYAVGEGGAVLRFDGRRWTPMSSGTSNDLFGVWGRSASDIYAVGAAGTILHYDGVRWSPMTSGTSKAIYSVYGASARVFAVGQSGLAMRYDGQSWTNVSLGSPALINVWAASDSVAFASGDLGKIYRFDGTQWQAMSSGTLRNLAGVWGSSPSNVYVVGALGTLLHFDGSSWSAVSTTSVASFQDISGASANEIVAVGLFGRVLRYDGQSWRESTTAIKQHGVWASAGHVFIAGDGGALLHDSGSGFVPTAAQTTNWLTSVWVGASGEAFAVGEAARVLRFDGTAWSPMNNPAGGTLSSVWGSSPSDVYAVGEDGRIIHYDGTQWSALASGTTAFLQQVWGTSKNNVLAVGPGGTVLRGRSGSGFMPMASSSSDFLISLWGSSPSDIYATGQTDLLHFDGTQWTKSALPGLRYHTVWGLSQSDVYATDLSSGIYRLSGSTFVPFYNPSGYRLTRLWGTSASDLTVIGERQSAPPGTVMHHYDGSAWQPARADLREAGALRCRGLLGISGGYAVGENELILRRAP
ncbi:MAG: hypothetical protein KC503_46265 [Myxococcales bacterium]|nr:hypothetical protein [Myxococcales bacterium]